jgi:hypothetical protein
MSRVVGVTRCGGIIKCGGGLVGIVSGGHMW